VDHRHAVRIDRKLLKKDGLGKPGNGNELAAAAFINESVFHPRRRAVVKAHGFLPDAAHPEAVRNAVQREEVGRKDSFMAVHQVKGALREPPLHKPGETDRRQEFGKGNNRNFGEGKGRVPGLPAVSKHLKCMGRSATEFSGQLRCELFGAAD